MTRKYISLNCEICGGGYSQQERLYKKAKWKNRCPEHRRNMDFSEKYRRAMGSCSDCGVEIDKRAERCKPCSGASRRTYTPKQCGDCGAEITRKAQNRCLSCHNKAQDKGLTRERTKFGASWAWRKARNQCLERDGHACSHCRAKGGGVKLEAHHIKEWCNHPELRLDVDNLLTLCRSCHKQHHKANGRPRRAA